MKETSTIAQRQLNQYKSIEEQYNQHDKSLQWGAIPLKRIDHKPIIDVETGYFNPHLWVTYECPNNCPACYLRALNDNEKSPDLSLGDLSKLWQSVKEYRENWHHFKVTMYGAEPQSKDPEYYFALMAITNTFFKGVRYNMYSSLQQMNRGWIDLFKEFARTKEPYPVAASWDGPTRGEAYNTRMFKNIRTLRNAGVNVCIMSVVNQDMLKLGAKYYIDTLEEYDIIGGFSLKPFIPIKGQWDKWNNYAANMEEFTQFAIECHQELIDRGSPHMSGMVHDTCHNNDIATDLGGETIFIDGWLRFLYMGEGQDHSEYLQEFGRLKEGVTFKDIIEGHKRKSHLARQRLTGMRMDCLTCEYAGRCLYEMYKADYDGSSECIGAKRFVKFMRENYGICNDTNI